jgi:hypothetical protein
MNRLHAILKAAALATVPIVGGFVCVVLFHINATERQLGSDSNGTFTALNKALDTVNHPCKPGPCGTLAKIAQSMNEVDSLASAANRAVLDADSVEKTEAKMLPEWNREFTETFAKVKDVAGNASDLLKATTSNEAVLTTSTTTAIGTLNDRIAAVKPIEDSTTLAVKHLDALVQSPVIPKLMDSGNELVSQSAGTMTEIHVIAKDARKAADKITAAKTKKQKVEAWLGFGLKLAICKAVGVSCTV